MKTKRKMGYRSIAIGAISAVVLLSFLPLFTAAKAASAAFQTQLVMSNAAEPYQTARIASGQETGHPVIELANGMNVWYGIDVTGSVGVKLYSATTQSENLLNWELAQQLLLPPVGAFPAELDPSSYTTNTYPYAKEQVTTEFIEAKQQMKLTLNPYEPTATVLDVLGMTAQLLGDSQEGNALGVLKLGNMQQIEQKLKTFTDLSGAAQAYSQVLRDAGSNGLQFTADTAIYASKLEQLGGTPQDQEQLAQMLQLYLGFIPMSTIQQAVHTLAGISEADIEQCTQKAIQEAGARVAPKGENPVITVETEPIGAPTPTPTPTTPSPVAGTIQEFDLSSSNLPSGAGSMVVGPDGNLWFTDEYSDDIGRVTPQGTVTLFPLHLCRDSGCIADSIINGPDGNLWFLETGEGNSIGKMTPQGKVTLYSLTSVCAPYEKTSACNPIDLIAGPDGNLWFVLSIFNSIDSYTSSTYREVAAIVRITPDGKITQFTDPAMAHVVDNSIPAIHAGPDNTIWYLETSLGANNVVTDVMKKMTVNGVISSFPIDSGADSFASQNWSFEGNIVTGSDGNLWFTLNSVIANTLGNVTPSGVVTKFPLPTAHSIPSNIMVGPDGNLWFTEWAATDAIARITPDGTITEYPQKGCVNSLTGPSYFSCVIQNLIVGPDGNLWFINNYSGAIDRITPTGTVTKYALPAADNATCFMPSIILVGPDNNVWFATGNEQFPCSGKIGRLTP